MADWSRNTLYVDSNKCISETFFRNISKEIISEEYVYSFEVQYISDSDALFYFYTKNNVGDELVVELGKKYSELEFTLKFDFVNEVLGVIKVKGEECWEKSICYN